MYKFIVMLRVKDGILFVHEWLKNMENLVDEIVVIDNGSTDGTYEALAAHPKVTAIKQTEGFNEGRDKNMVYAMARERKPDWCLWIDVDEVFEPELTRADFDRLMGSQFITKYKFRRFHFIDREHFAGSGTYFFYTSIHDRVMWKEQASGYFEDFILDSPNIKGIKGIEANTHFRLKHLGYINKELVDKKVDIYKAVIDPKKQGSLKNMYLDKEIKIKWNDHRKSKNVRLLNLRLDIKQFISLFPRAFSKLSKLLKKLTDKNSISFS